jgi:glycosyltransferase involved in cell wall biosynthesis
MYLMERKIKNTTLASQPLVSVLIPAYNASSYVYSTIESVVNQSYRNLEIIICDDASTDDTTEIVKKFMKKDKRIKLYVNKSNFYIAGNRNNLLSYAKGEFIAWMDADDISRSNRIEKQLEVILADSSIGICGGWLSVFRGSPDNVVEIRKYPKGDLTLRRLIFRVMPVAQPAALIRRTALDTVGKYDLSTPPAEDLDMLFRIGSKYKFANVQEVVIDYRDHPNSATYKKLQKIEKETVRIRKLNMKNQAYNSTITDKIYNNLHWLSIWIVPPAIKIRLFQTFRKHVVK